MSGDESFPIVGIGASAGGVQALDKLFRSMPPDTGMAFVVVTHLLRGHESLLPEILGRCTTMPVQAAPHDAPVEPDHVYLGHADSVLTIENRRLQLKPRRLDVHVAQIDVFLASLAEDVGDAAIGIVLSGSGTDGALGLKAIRGNGGLTLAQGHNGSAPLHSQMPDTAIAAGVVDLILPVEEMAARMLSFIRDADTVDGVSTGAEPQGDGTVPEAYQTIHLILLKQVGHDFRGYKQRTFQRRVKRRMQVLLLPTLDRYVERLRADPGEVTNLFQDLLIGVTSFFRDMDAFESLEQIVVPRLFERRGRKDSIRIWIPACATGEEVYSIALLIREYMDTLAESPKIQIFATDVDEAALHVARAGRYPAQLISHLSPARLKRFFSREDGTYVILKSIRDMCVFSTHSVLRDPPFSRVDLISCRNLLIYLGPEFQAQVIPVFHFALAPQGFLFLGTSESVSQHGDLFAPVDKKQRIFQRRDHVVAPLPLAQFAHSAGIATVSAGEARRDPGGIVNGLRRMIETRVIERFAPAHVVVNREGDILHYSARTGKYLEPAAGMPNRQLIAMARKGLRLDLRTALREAVETRRIVERKSIEVEIDDRSQMIDLLIEPVGDRDGDPLFLVMFKDVGTPAIVPEAARSETSEGDARVERLEQDLRDTRERLQSTIEEYETAVEELKSSNEELQSVNEELQSTNEELETSKEELQSLNEELHTVNAELTVKIEEVDRANADLRSIFASTQIAIVFLDRDLVMRTFTPAAATIFNLIPTDRGRPLSDIANSLEDGDLHRDIRTALERGDTIERNVRRTDGKAHYLMRILPYRTQGAFPEGVLVTFVDITAIVQAEAHEVELVEELNNRVRQILALVGAIARESLASGAPDEAFAASFSARIHALGATYALIARKSWREVALADIIRVQLDAFERQASDAIAIDGPPVLFKPPGVLALGLAFHELLTNAKRHGALSAANGQVSISWTVTANGQPAVVLRWREEGRSVKKPAKKGFGMALIERGLRQDLGASVKFTFGASALTVQISIPLDRDLIAMPAAEKAAE